MNDATAADSDGEDVPAGTSLDALADALDPDQAWDGRCRPRTASETRFVDAHHIRWWERGGPTDIDNLILLCWYHHDAIHHGDLVLEVVGPGRVAFHLAGRDVPA